MQRARCPLTAQRHSGVIVAIQRRSGVMLGVTRVSSLGTAARCLEKSGGDPLRPALAGLAIATRHMVATRCARLWPGWRSPRAVTWTFPAVCTSGKDLASKGR